MSSRNPEQDVVDAIDQLVDEQLAQGPTDDYNRPYSEKCPQCGGSWHGLQRGDCPGATGIAGNPDGGEPGQLVLGRADDGSHPLTDTSRFTVPPGPILRRFVALMERTAATLETITGVPFTLRSDPPTRLVVPLMREVSWGPERGRMALENVVIECVAAPSSPEACVYRVYCGNQVHVIRVTSREVEAQRGRGPFIFFPLTNMPGFRVLLVVEEDGMVVANLARSDGGGWVRMGFRRAW